LIKHCAYEKIAIIEGDLQIAQVFHFYPHNVVSAVLATTTWLAGWLSVTAGIVSKRVNVS